MEENNSEFLDYADISSVVIESLKDNPNASKNNDFAISTDTSRRPVTIQISLGKGMEKIRSTIEKKLKAGEFVIRKDEDLEDELYFVFFKKDLEKQPTDNNVKDVLFLPTVKILEALNESKKEKDAVHIAYLVHDYISNANKSMAWRIGWRQKILDLYNGKNNENNNNNENIDLNNNEHEENKDKNSNIFSENIDSNNNFEDSKNKENNINNLNNNLNNNIPNENKEIKNENSNIFNENIGFNNLIINNNPNNNIINQEDNNQLNNLNDNIDPNNNRKNTVSLFGLNGCYEITKEEQSDHACGCCFW